MIKADDLQLAARPSAPVKRRPLMAGFGPTLDAYLMIAKAHATMRAIALRPQNPPPLDAQMQRLTHRFDEAQAARAKAIKAKNWKAVSAANSKIRKTARTLHDLRTAQLDAADSSRASLEAAVMATIRGEPVEEVETVVADWLRDDDGARKIKRGRAILVEERATTIRRPNRETGLALAFRNGDLDGGSVRAETLLYIGGIYGDALRVVRRHGGARIASISDSPGGRSSGLSASERAVEAAIVVGGLQNGMSARQLKVLDLVCCQEMSLRAAREEMKMGVPALARVLVAGLTVAWENRVIG